MDEEDYLKMMPQELRYVLEKIREMDLDVHNNVATLEERAQDLFEGCQENELKKDQADREYNYIRDKYKNVMEDADTKVDLVTKMSKYAKQCYNDLDRKIQKMKCELEAENSGITEVLEKRALGTNAPLNPVENLNDNLFSLPNEMPRLVPTTDHKSLSNPSENKKAGSIIKACKSLAARRATISTDAIFKTQKQPEKKLASTEAIIKSNSTSVDNCGRNTSRDQKSMEACAHPTTDRKAREQLEKRRDSCVTFEAPVKKKVAVCDSITCKPIRARRATTTQPFLPATLNEACDSYIGPERAIAAAATIAVPQKIQNRRRTTISKANLNGTGSAGSTVAATVPKNGNDNAEKHSLASTSSCILQPFKKFKTSSSKNEVIDLTSDDKWTYDTSAPRYCICNQVSYGDMIACDNKNCKIEWFHYPCVGITSAPRGTWYCPKCIIPILHRKID